MEISLNRVKSKYEQDFNQLLSLYIESFPAEERRDIQQFQSMLAVPEMKFSTIRFEEEVVGFIILWDFDSFGYIEHFAVFPKYRGKNLGSYVLKLIGKKAPKLLLETEKPYDEISERRIGFYARNGFQILPIAYLQPPYRKGEALLPMHLLSNTTNWGKWELEKSIAIFQEEVYYRYH